MNYEITWDEIELEDESKIPESLKPQLQSLHDDVMNGKSRVIPRLKKLIKEYPFIVQLKNYLSAAYKKTGKLKKAMKVNDQVLKENPDYLFARINKACKLHRDGEYDQMPKLLGIGFDLQALYPDRDLFHISEFLAMQGAAVRYFTAKEEFEEAEKRLEMMQEMDEDTPQCELAEKIFFNATLEAGRKRMAKEKEQRITPKNKMRLKQKEFKRPAPNIPATAELYEYDMEIPDKVIQSFFEHDRNQVIEDLENVLKDSYFNYSSTRNHQEEPFAAIHAFFLS